jgi:hypothetical protein
VRPGSFQGEAGKEWEYLRVTYLAAIIAYELGFPHLALILSGWNVMGDGNVEGDGLLEASVNLAWGIGCRGDEAEISWTGNDVRYSYPIWNEAVELASRRCHVCSAAHGGMKCTVTFAAAGSSPRECSLNALSPYGLTALLRLCAPTVRGRKFEVESRN